MNPAVLPPPGTRYLPDWYIPRPHEEQLAARYLHYGQPVLLWGPRHQGRTWLRAHITHAWQTHEPRRAPRPRSSISAPLARAPSSPSRHACAPSPTCSQRPSAPAGTWTST